MKDCDTQVDSCSGKVKTTSQDSQAGQGTGQAVHADAQQDRDREYLQLAARLLCMVSVQAEFTICAVAKEEKSAPDDRNTSLLLGSCVIPPLVIDDCDLDGEKMLVFVFADLALRVPGNYALACRIVDMHKLQVSHTLVTRQFTVYNAKEFPGKSRNYDRNARLDVLYQLSL
jgi:hypothetical protein